MLFLSILFYYSAILATTSVNACLSLYVMISGQMDRHSRMPLHTNPRSMTPFKIVPVRGCIPRQYLLYVMILKQLVPTTYGDRAFPVAAVRTWKSSAAYHNLLRHFLSSALAWRHTSSNSVTRNYCCCAIKVTLSFMDTLIALTCLLTYSGRVKIKQS